MAKRRVGGSAFVPAPASRTASVTVPAIGAAAAKYGAERCIVGADGTITTETELHRLATFRGTSPATTKRLTLAELATALGVVGTPFPSLKEGRRYIDLTKLVTAGLITDLELQPPFELHVAKPLDAGGYEPIYVGRFTADFRYLDLTNGEVVIEDTKSEFTRTTAYQLRKKMAEAEYGITVREL
jgi:hypothetical protein